MKTTRQRTAWIAFAAALFGGIAEGGAADEQRGTGAAASPPPTDAIEIARREFEAVKSQRDPALQLKSEFPRVSIPDMRATPPAAIWTAPKSAIPEKKSTNWLVEAMEKSAEARNGRARSGSSPERERARESLKTEKENDREHETSRETRSSQDGAEERERKSDTAVANPLAGFLGTWMTAQDYALLKPSLEQAFGALSGTSASQSTGLAGAMAALPLAGADGIIPSNTAAPRAAPVMPRENPYLAMLNAPPIAPGPVPPVSAPPLLSMGPSLAPAAPVAAPARPNSQSVIPDFAKPATDEKYFKQLKRF